MWILPAGAFRQPEGGWFLAIPHSFRVDNCSSYAAYHLDTGAAYWGEVCEDDEGERHEGVVSSDRVREAVLLTLLAEHAVLGAPVRDEVQIPHGLVPMWPAGFSRPIPWRRSKPRVWVDHETEFEYVWWDGDVIAEGRVLGPYHGTGAEAHARSLIFDLHWLAREGLAPTDLPAELSARLRLTQ